MKQHLKQFLKKNIPARMLELFSYKAVSITKIPAHNVVISDLFVLRLEDGWETYFECLRFDALLNPNLELGRQTVIFCFYTKEGQFITERKLTLSKEIKKTINVNELVGDLSLKEDGLFAVFHPQKNYWINQHDSFLAERGYIGYANKRLGSIKAFVHGNLDAIARNFSGKLDQLLGTYSFFKNEYRLQHSLEPGNSYELYLVNSTQIKQSFTIVEQLDQNENKTTITIPSKGFFKYVKTVNKNECVLKIIIQSRLYLARPIVFKIMTTSFDVFHG